MLNHSSVMLAIGAATLGAGCASTAVVLPPGVGARQFVVDSAAALEAQRFRPDLCDGFDLHPDRGALSEASVVRFLEGRGFGVQIQRQQVDETNRELHFLFVTMAGGAQTLPLRVAVLPTVDAAGRSLYEAVLRRGPGAWGVHRANLAVLGPTTADPGDAVALAGLTKMACWGTFTAAGTDDAFVVPGAYAEP
jgi:hypothetical protein